MSSTDNFVANQFLDLSKEIEKSVQSKKDVKLSNEYAFMRSAISRAYYSAFLSLRDILLNNPKWRRAIKTGKDEHETLRLTLFSLPIAFQPIANDFNNLRKRRNNADYDLPPIFRVKLGHVTRSNSEAGKIINTIPILTKYLSTQYP